MVIRMERIWSGGVLGHPLRTLIIARTSDSTVVKLALLQRDKALEFLNFGLLDSVRASHL